MCKPTSRTAKWVPECGSRVGALAVSAGTNGATRNGRPRQRRRVQQTDRHDDHRQHQMTKFPSIEALLFPSPSAIDPPPGSKSSRPPFNGLQIHLHRQRHLVDRDALVGLVGQLDAVRPRMIVGIFATLTRYVMSQVAVKPAARTDLPRTAVAPLRPRPRSETPRRVIEGGTKRTFRTSTRAPAIGGEARATVSTIPGSRRPPSRSGGRGGRWRSRSRRESRSAPLPRRWSR